MALPIWGVTEMHTISLGLAAILTAFSIPAAAAPADVNADGFYRDAQALMKKGMGAMFDKRTRPMMAQMKDAGTRARAANQTATAAGKPLYCVPEAARKKGLGPQQVVAMLGRLPESERRSLTLADAWKRALARDYPCR